MGHSDSGWKYRSRITVATKYRENNLPEKSYWWIVFYDLKECHDSNQEVHQFDVK